MDEKDASSLLVQVRTETVDKLRKVLEESHGLLSGLQRLEDAGVSMRSVFESALRQARQSKSGSAVEKEASRKKIAAGMHTVIAQGSEVYACGFEPCGLSHAPGMLRAPLEDGDDVVSVGAGWCCTVIATRRGRVYCGGLVENEDAIDWPLRPVSIPSRVRLVTAGARHVLALDVMGRAFSWGSNDDGRLGRFGSGVKAALIELDCTLRSVAAGACHSLFVAKDGRLFATGFGGNGRLGLGTEDTMQLPTEVPLDHAASFVAAGKYHSLVLCDRGNKLFAFGDNAYGQLGLGHDQDQFSPSQVLGLPPARRITHLAAGAAHSLLLLDDTQVWGFGNNDVGQLGIRTEDHNTSSASSSGDDDDDDSAPAAIDEREDHDLLYIDDDPPSCDDEGSFLSQEFWLPVRIDAFCGLGAIEIAAGSDPVNDHGHSLVLTADGRVMSCGSQDHGQCGHDDRSQTPTLGSSSFVGDSSSSNACPPTSMVLPSSLS